MAPDVIDVRSLENYELLVTFADGECRRFSMLPYLDYPAFRGLRELGRFFSAHVENGTVAWSDETDISPESLYLAGQRVDVATP